MRQIEKYPRSKIVQNKHFYVYAKFKNFIWNVPLPEAPNSPWVPPPPETRQTSIFLFYSLYASMVTRNKFFTFPARLTPPGSRSIGTTIGSSPHSKTLPLV